MELELQSDVRTSLHVTREAIQAIEVLAYSLDELSSFLRDQYERNPLLSVRFPMCGQRASVASGAASSTAVERGRGSNDAPGQQSRIRDNGGGVVSAGRSGTDAYDYEAVLRHDVTLREHLHFQLSLLSLQGPLRALAGQIIDSLEPDGYLRRELWEMADLMSVSSEELERAVEVVQQFEPVGVAARNLRECLLLQLRERGPLQREMATLVEHLDLVERGEIQRLCRRCNIDKEELAALLAQLRTLDPRPGLACGKEIIQPALPDILVTESNDGDLRVELNPALLPKVLIDRQYYMQLSTHVRGREDGDFLRSCVRSANNLIRNLDQRAKTTLKIAHAVINHHEAFFRGRARELLPLTQKDIAGMTGVHESTVSRAIANKYISSKKGLLPLKSLFPEAIGARGSEQQFASTTIHDRIKTLVASETVDHVLSDDVIVTLLCQQGIEIARRTVAKYRTILDIPSSADRRRLLRTRQLL